MKRPYLALATFALVAALIPGPISGVRANGHFNSAPVEANSFAVLARPVAADDWTLVVLEQLRSRPFCWTPRPDGLVDPTLNRFDYTGICGRFIDSNGYSLRIEEEDLGHAYRLRLERQGNTLRLLATTASRGAELVVGRGTVVRRERDLFVPLRLEPGWELRRRTFGERSLNHVYFSNGQPLDTLIAAARGRSPEDTATRLGAGMPLPPAAPPPLLAINGERDTSGDPPRDEAPLRSRDRRSRDLRSRQVGPQDTSPAETRQQARGSRIAAPTSLDTPGDVQPTGVIALQVIPYEERGAVEGRPRNDERAGVGGRPRKEERGGVEGRPRLASDNLPFSQGQ
ncbi:MAG: DUF3747 domain-containing protein [Cyanobacteria bacterium K_Offshore_surface_m2_239]|nr:DUF3747 domain-containing protein [Cyanobacteria bacterium K_Offshore_surface_m2_239]